VVQINATLIHDRFFCKAMTKTTNKINAILIGFVLLTGTFGLMNIPNTFAAHTFPTIITVGPTAAVKAPTFALGDPGGIFVDCTFITQSTGVASIRIFRDNPRVQLGIVTATVGAGSQTTTFDITNTATFTVDTYLVSCDFQETGANHNDSVSHRINIIVPPASDIVCSAGDVICKQIAILDQDGDGIIEIGEPITYIMSIQVDNTSPGTWKKTVVKDRFGAELDVIEPPLSISQGSVELKQKGNSEKEFLTWKIGALVPGASANLVLKVVTDLTPDGFQSYTECSNHEFNSGATLKFRNPANKQVSFETGGIIVSVLTVNAQGDCDGRS